MGFRFFLIEMDLEQEHRGHWIDFPHNWYSNYFSALRSSGNNSNNWNKDNG